MCGAIKKIYNKINAPKIIKHFWCTTIIFADCFYYQEIFVFFQRKKETRRKALKCFFYKPLDKYMKYI